MVKFVLNKRDVVDKTVFITTHVDTIQPIQRIRYCYGKSSKGNFLVQKNNLSNICPMTLIRKESFACMCVCFLTHRERSVGHTPNGDQCSPLGTGMG